MTNDPASNSQTWRIGTLIKAAGFPVPQKVYSDSTLASGWISIALASLTENEYSSLEKPPKRSEKPVPHEILNRLASVCGFELPNDSSPQTLHAWLFALGCAAPIPQSNKLLRYWQRALIYRDLNEFAKDQALAITDQPIPQTLPQSLPRLSSNFKTLKAGLPGDAVALLLAYAPEHGKVPASALLGIPLAYDETSRSLMPPVGGAVPFFNREWLEPPDPDAQKNAYFGTVLDCDEYFSSNPPPQNASWPDYWNYVESFVRAITGASDPMANLAPVVWRKDTAWKIVAWDAGGAGKKIADTYKRALDGEQAPLLTRMCTKSSQPPIFGVAEALHFAHALSGHIDAYDRAKQNRAGFGLEKSQRIAATAMTQVAGGDILTVNGPPGTGKTSFLRAVIGTLCVQSALDGGPPPLILATAATNKAVTNIIESFSEVPGPEMQPDWQSRWLPNLPSYGWFFPASSKPDDEYKNFMVLRKDWGNKGDRPKIVMTAASFSFFANQDQKRQWLLDNFLDLHRRTLGLAAKARDAKHAANMIHTILAQSVERMHGLQEAFRRCLETPKNHQSFSHPESAWEGLAASLEAQESALESRYQQANGTLHAWNHCLGQFREAATLRAGRSGLLYAIKKLFLGDRLELQAQAVENAALARIVQLDPKFSVYGELQPQAVEYQQTQAASRVPKIGDELCDVQQKLQSAQSMLVQWVAWRAEVAQISEHLGTAGIEIEKQVAAWEKTGFNDSYDINLRFEEALDKCFRFLHFHMAARYWEARWLADVPAPKDNGNILLSLRRATMLAPVIVSTVYTLPRIYDEFQFADLLIFDESGQASPEIGAASFAFAKRAIVVGDIHQLKPVWNVGKEADARLSTDIDIDDMPEALSASAGSIMKTAQTVTAFTTNGEETLGPGIGLVAHYRCRADIIEYCRRLIYGEGLSPCRIEHAPNEQADFLYPPMAWVAVTPKESAQRENGSWINRDQIREIVRWLRHDKARLLAHYGKTRLSDIVALIAPFRAQANALRKAVVAELGEEEGVTMVINTVHALQGAEKPIVAFSLTQDGGNFFVDRDGPNLLNVAVSRAKDCFILFAAPDVIQANMNGKTAHIARNARDIKPLDLLVNYMNEKGKRLYPREVVIIEAPGKESRVSEALGLSAHVVPTGGHFRRLKMDGGRLLSEITNKDTVDALERVTKDLRHIDYFYLATDDDDDGEEIAWHVQEVLRSLGVDDSSRIRRMRFYSLAADDIRQARELALPGIDARRVRANLFRGLFDASLHKQLGKAGIKASRPQLALLNEIHQRASVPGHWRLNVSGGIAGKKVTGYVLHGDGKHPATYSCIEAATAFAATVPVGIEVQQHDVATHSVTIPRYPAGTTAQTLIAAYRRYQWPPSRTMNALEGLYLGHSSPKSYGVGIDNYGHATTGTDS